MTMAADTPRAGAVTGEQWSRGGEGTLLGVCPVPRPCRVQQGKCSSSAAPGSGSLACDDVALTRGGTAGRRPVTGTGWQVGFVGARWPCAGRLRCVAMVNGG